jgi:hypothetical protein
MKHVKTVSSSIPAPAFIQDHPDSVASVTGFLKDPTGTINSHLSKGADAG